MTVEERELEALKAMGEEAARAKFASVTKATYGHVAYNVLEKHIKDLDDSKRENSASKIIDLASRANRIAYTALIIAVIAAHKDIMWLISSIKAFLS